ncbi:MAG: ISLre2 family transposase, partial [Firmicutes bacterium]|nr:ISLre2 family transposase [Bacillota bacterium]
MDRYHLSKYVFQATAHMSHTTSIMWSYINNGDKKNFIKLTNAIISSTETDMKKKAVQGTKRYILTNWEGIMNQHKADYAGCSAEAHVSHIFSSRLSSRPLGWCKTGADQMARLRVFAANGG